ncbi:MAG: cbb3-type cytochrome oxidase assembly protein CcoS [Candidatus Competibacterales bacterium]|nr:cbb3-type cytochrome oxidase assembly protein CcoS [Candidatus Competibacterales bacterium]
MTSLVVLIPLSILLLVLGIAIFFWAVRRGQFEDLDTPAWRVVLDDDSKPPQADRNGKPESRRE